MSTDKIYEIAPIIRMLYKQYTPDESVFIKFIPGSEPISSDAVCMDFPSDAAIGLIGSFTETLPEVYIRGLGSLIPRREKFERNKRLSGKIAAVTGGAQGFGRGIAEYLASEGAKVVIADINIDPAKDFCEQLGEGNAIAVKTDVTDEKSVENMINETAKEFGGLDLFINNAGIVRAGGLDELSRRDFDLVTSVNYTAYFLCAKYASKMMKIQHGINQSHRADIIEINSKSGLEGSNKNFAYAGSKFGGIGLTQSFALELAPYNIKVNAICPGNFLDGPLWSDPEKGLFVQYLNSGKVPGARTVADVKAYYESKVPLGRGCRIEDVTRAVLYLVEQEYETGQALPVTGGQVMLS